ncbi:DUF4214 domain-containing protein [Halomonas sp. Bachu 37]|uniref:DUF4214 domain-containing protein n=1 Tax=Halomonas kashgarensis TaxID=3084920 RepID=UPI003217BD00
MATQENLELAQQLYIAYYGRPADEAGQTYWAEQIEEDGLAAAVEGFGTSDEYTSRFGDMTDEELVNNLYQQAFNRDADEGGLEFYVGKLESGELDLASIALTIVQNAADVDAQDLTTLNNKQAAAQLFTDAAGENYSDDEAADYASEFLADVNAETDVDADIDIDAVVADIPQQSVPGDDFSLTTGVNDLTGTADDDTFSAPLDQVTDPATGDQFQIQTLTSVDLVDGGEGTDRLNARLVDNSADNVVIENVEQLYFRSTNDNAALNASGVTGVEQLWNDRSSADLDVTNVQNSVVVGLNAVRPTSTDGFSVAYADGVLGSSAFAQTLVANGAGTQANSLDVDITAGTGDTITSLNVDASGLNNIELQAGLDDVTALNVTGDGSLNLNTLTASLESIAAGDHAGGLTLTAADGDLQEVTTGAGDDSLTLAGNLLDEGFVNTGAGDDNVNAGGSDVEAGASIDLGAGDDVVSNLGTVDKDASVDGGEGTDTLQLQAVAAANVGAFSNFEVFDVNALDKTLDLNILSADNDVQEIVGTGATGADAELTNVGADVGFRATADMGTTNDIVLTQATAGALDVTLDADQAATASATDDNIATTTVAATNATSVNAVFDSESVNEIAGGITNVQTIDLTVGDSANTTGGATSITIDSSGENAANVLVLSDDTENADGDSVLTELTITGDQDLDITDISSTNGSAIESVDAGALTGDLTVDLGTLANGGEVTLGSGADTVEVGVNAGAATGDIESIVGFEASESTTDAELIADADIIDFVNDASIGAGSNANVEVEDGVATFLGAGPSTLDQAIDFVNSLDMAQNAAVAFEYVGDTYTFIEGTAAGVVDAVNDSVVKLAGVTDVDSLNINGDANLYIA